VYYYLGYAYSLTGQPDFARAYHNEGIRLAVRTALDVALGFDVMSPEAKQIGGVSLASPPLPDESSLRQCRTQSSSNDDFMTCMVDQAMPKEYQLTRQCIQNNQEDGGRAFVCSTGNQDLVQGYDRYRQVQGCTKQSTDNWDVAQCVGQQVLGENEQYYLSCITKNRGDYKTAAVCAIAKDLTPEQQIALSCAISTGAQPYAFAACAGGQLLARELDKCWQNGIATDQGCFGPNNEYRKYLNNYAELVRQAFGDNSAVYQAYMLWQNNVLAPGPNHEVVKFLNNGLQDIQNGPGPNNEYVKAANAVGDAIQSVGNALGF
jgi:hypothetical protein